MWLEYVTSRFNTCIDDIYLVSHVKHIFHFLAVEDWIWHDVEIGAFFTVNFFVTERVLNKGFDLCQRKSGIILNVIYL